MKLSKKQNENIKKFDFDLIRQFSSSLEDLKKGRFKRLDQEPLQDITRGIKGILQGKIKEV